MGGEERKMSAEEKEWKIEDMELVVTAKKVTGYQKDSILTQKEFDNSIKYLIDVYYCTRSRFCSRCHSYIGEGDKLYTVLVLIPRDERRKIYDAFKCFLCEDCAKKYRLIEK